VPLAGDATGSKLVRAPKVPTVMAPPARSALQPWSLGAVVDPDGDAAVVPAAVVAGAADVVVAPAAVVPGGALLELSLPQPAAARAMVVISATTWPARRISPPWVSPFPYYMLTCLY